MRNIILNMIGLQMFILLPSFATSDRTVNSERIVGKWISKEKDLIVEVYKCGEEFKGRVLWFDNKEEPGTPLNAITDSNNPDPLLRNRKILGMDVLRSLHYKVASDSWEDGLIYDSSSGREWRSCASFTAPGYLRVKGYWHFKCIGRSMDFVLYKGGIK